MSIARWLHAARARLGQQDGFSLVELIGALTIVAIGFLALAGTASSAARLLVQGRQRQAAAETANKQLEHLRNIPFDQVALPSALTQSADPDHPNAHVSNDGLGYDHDADNVHEDLVIDSSGQVVHLESVTVGTTALELYHYVTWVDDPDVSGTEDYKRLTIEALYVDPVGTARPGSVRVSALFTPGSVTVAGTGSSPTGGSSSSPSPTPSPTPTGSCSGDTTAPGGTFSILSGTGASTGFTASTTVTISLAPSDPCTPIQVQLSNDNATYGSWFTYDAGNPTVTWTVPPGDGLKQVWARFKDAAGNSAVKGPQSITLDQTAPTAPGILTRTVSCSGSDRTVTLSWGAATDANLQAYRVYRSIDGEAYAMVLSTTTLTGSDTHKKNLDSVRFKIVAYDKAGNEGPASNEVSLAKNQCS